MRHVGAQLWPLKGLTVRQAVVMADHANQECMVVGWEGDNLEENSHSSFPMIQAQSHQGLSYRRASGIKAWMAQRHRHFSLCQVSKVLETCPRGCRCLVFTADHRDTRLALSFTTVMDLSRRVPPPPHSATTLGAAHRKDVAGHCNTAAPLLPQLLPLVPL